MLSEFIKDFTFVVMPSKYGGNKDSGKMVRSVEKPNISPDFAEMEVSTFRNLTWLYIPYILDRGSSIVRCKEMNWGQDMPLSEPPFTPFFHWFMFHFRYSSF